MKNRNKIIALFVTLTASMFIYSCGEDDSNEKAVPVKVEAIVVKKAAMANQMEFPGTVAGEQKVKLSTKLMGEITYLPFESGNRVKKGEVLVKINSGDISAKKEQVEANIMQAEAAFQNAETNYERIKSLYEKNSATKKEMEDVKMAYEMAKAQLNAAREMKNEIENVLSYSEIRAPFDGYIVNKFFQKGDIAAPGHPIMIIENFDQYEVTAQVPASEINNLSEGQPASVIVDAGSEKSYDGKIIEINPSGNAYSKQFEIKVSIDNNSIETGTLKSGMYATIVIDNQDQSAITVDESMLVRRGQLVGVYSISNNNEVLLRWIRLGKSIDGKYEVLSGLAEGDLIITEKDKVNEGQKVEVI